MLFIPINTPLITPNISIETHPQTITPPFVYYTNPNMPNTKAKLEEAAKGLWMMSESDYPFDYFTTEATTIDNNLALKLAEKPAGTTIEIITLDHLLRNMMDASRGSVPAEDAQKFRNLYNVLKQELKDITVYRVGDIQIDVFIIGKTVDGTVVGMKTLLIET